MPVILVGYGYLLYSESAFRILVVYDNPDIQFFFEMVRYYGKHKIEFYESIEELPISQFHRYQKYVMVDCGVGDDIASVDSHITKVINYLSDPKKARCELLNLRQNIYMIIQGMDIKHKAPFCLVKRVDGKPWEDFSDEGIEKLYSFAEGERLSELNGLARDLSKKINEGLAMYFPDLFGGESDRNLAELMKRRALLQIGEIVKGEDNKEKIESLTKQMFSYQTPKSFSGAENAEIKFDKEFEDMCLAMSKEFGGEVKRYTTMQFYTAFERMGKEAEEMKKLRRRK